MSEQPAKARTIKASNGSYQQRTKHNLHRNLQIFICHRGSQRGSGNYSNEPTLGMLKKPAAADNGKPEEPGKPKGPSPLSAANLSKHNAEDPNQAQALWKRFEYARSKNQEAQEP